MSFCSRCCARKATSALPPVCATPTLDVRVASRFELFVARRYLRAKRKQAVISLITAISVMGVAAGVMALIIALAINTGFRNTLQRNLLGATAHVTILEKEPGNGI